MDTRCCISYESTTTGFDDEYGRSLRERLRPRQQVTVACTRRGSESEKPPKENENEYNGISHALILVRLLGPEVQIGHPGSESTRTDRYGWPFT